MQMSQSFSLQHTSFFSFLFAVIRRKSKIIHRVFSSIPCRGSSSSSSSSSSQICEIMRRPRSTNEVMFIGGRRKWKPIHLILMVTGLYVVFIYLKFPHFLQIAYMLGADDEGFIGFDRAVSGGSGLARPLLEHDAFHRKLEDSLYSPGLEKRGGLGEGRPVNRPLKHRFGMINGEIVRWRWNWTEGELSEIDKLANEAWVLGTKAWEEVESYDVETGENVTVSAGSESGKQESCPLTVMTNKEDMQVVGKGGERLMFLPCGLAAGSSITVVGTPDKGHVEYVPQLAMLMPGTSPMVTVSQFMVELQGLKVVDGEDPPRIFHLNPRLKGDWSSRPVIEHNTCYRMQWGSAQRCDGLQSKDEDEKVDGFSKCEKWVRDGVVNSKESKTTSWLNRFIGRAKKPAMTWPFPFVEGKLFVLTIRAGLEGFHINVGGRHTTSFPYRPGFSLEDATGLAIKGNVDIHSVYATSLPVSHPSFSLKQVLDMSSKWKSRPLPASPVDVFIGILSATNHFSERMAIRKTWMTSDAIKSSKVVARFFVALNPRKEVNLLLKKEADYFGDIVILPFMDRYELVVLKTIAICEYGVQNMTADYIMKCDDDTFVRVDTILKEIYSVSRKKSLYMGNLNLLHKPLRTGKWAVTYEEWPEAVYPPYANGPGYIISIDIARYVALQHVNQSLKLFKMEDVSMGMWVEQFNMSTSVQYSHNWKFCQYGCVEDYYTAHYQSPRQMICLWDKLARGRAQCCNFR